MEKENIKGFNELLRKTSLKTRLKISNRRAFISLLSKLGYRKNKYWTLDENELLNKLCKEADKHTKHQLNEIKEWQDDGKPD